MGDANGQPLRETAGVRDTTIGPQVQVSRAEWYLAGLSRSKLATASREEESGAHLMTLIILCILWVDVGCNAMFL